MTENPFPTPTRKEKRGEFPEHSDHQWQGKLLPADVARRIARERLEKWREEYGG